MADIAEIGFAADTSALDDSKAALQGLVAPAKAAESSASKLSATLAKLDSAADKLVAAASGLATTSERLAAALNKDAGAANAAAAGLDRAGSSANAAAAGIDHAAAAAARGDMNLRAFGIALDQAALAGRRMEAGIHNLGTTIELVANSAQQLDAHVAAYNARMASVSKGTEQLDAHVNAFRKSMGQAGKAVQLTGHDLLAFTRQGADVGVTLAAGMSPFMVAIQQGPQIFDAFQVAAMRTGTTVGAVFKAVGVTIWTALAPILPLIVGITAVVGTLAAAWGLANRAISKGIGDNIDHLKLNEKQLERLKDKGVNIGVTMGDTFKALGTTVKEYFVGAFGDQIDWLSDKWNSLLDTMTKGLVGFAKFVVGVFTGMVAAVQAVWSNLPNIMLDAFTTGANKVIAAAEFMGNAIAKALDPVGAALGTTPQFKLGRLDNTRAGAAAQGGRDAATAFGRGFAAGGEGVDEFGRRWRDNARATRDARVREAAGKAGKTPKGPKTDAEKFDDITRGAENDIAALKAQREAIGLSAQAAAELEQKTKLLAQANQKGITLTAEMRAKVDELAAAYGRETQALINAQFAHDMVRETDREIAALEAQRKAIGLTGRDLAYQTKLTELATKAIEDQVEITDDLTKAMEEQANRYADAFGNTDAAQFYHDQTLALKDLNAALTIERATIGMTDEAAQAYLFTQNLLNDAKRRGIELSPEEIATLQAANREYIAQKKEIDAVREAIAFAKDASRGFFNDMMAGLREGKSFWETFGNAVANILTKLADKLADMAFDGLFQGAGGKGGGGFLNSIIGGLSGLFSKNAKGNAFDGSGITRFAKGGAFTNSIVSKPTLFQFAQGAALGEMGEAGPEAIMPLMRGSDGSLGVQAHGGGMSMSGGQPQRVELSVKAYPTDTLYAEIETIARDEAVTVTQEGIQQYDALMPSRVNEIAQDDRVR